MRVRQLVLRMGMVFSGDGEVGIKSEEYFSIPSLEAIARKGVIISRKRNGQGLSYRALGLNEVQGVCVDEEESAEDERKVRKETRVIVP